MKKVGISIALVVVLLGAIFFLGRNPLKNIAAEDIQEIYISGSTGPYFTITRQDDIQKMLETLKSSDVKRELLPSYRAGYAFELELRLKTGDITEISILGNSAIINGKHYETTTAYCDNVSELFNLFSETYPVSSF